MFTFAQTCNISVSPSSIYRGQSATVYCDATPVTYNYSYEGGCSASATYTPTCSASGTVSPTQSTTYTCSITCTEYQNPGCFGGGQTFCSGGGGSGYYSATLTVLNPPSCTFNGQTIPHGSSVTAYQASTVPYGSTCVSQTRTCSYGTLSGSYQYSSCTVLSACPTALTATSDSNGYNLFASVLSRLINKLGFNFCVSNSGTYNYFIPAKTSAELQSFYNAAPGLPGLTRFSP